MAASIRISFSDDEVAAAVRALGRLGRDLRPLMDDIGEHLVNSTQDRILAGGPAPDGARWPAWNPLYAAGRSAKGGGMLNLSGVLRATIEKEAGRRSVRVGSNRIYAAIHQFGGTIRPKNAKALKFRMGGRFFALASVTIPARPFLGVSADDAAEIRALFADHVSRATARAGGRPTGA